MVRLKIISMAYSNGFNLTKVMEKLVGRVGWVQTPGVPTLTSPNTTATSGRYFNDGSFHALVTLKNIKDVMENGDVTDAEFNAYLLQLQRSIIIRSLTGVFSEKEYVEQTMLYRRYGGTLTALSNSGKFIGIRIMVPPSESLAIQIDSVALMFDSTVTFNLYLFNDAIKAPIKTVSVTTVAGSQKVVDLDETILNFVGPDNMGGVFYLGYFQDDIGSAKAIREEDAQFVCNTTFGYSMVESVATGLDFDRSQISYSAASNGLNTHISVFRDHTQNIVKKPSLFDNLIGLQMSAQVVEQILFSTRSNGIERALKDGVDKAMGMMQLEGVAPISDSPSTTGLRKQITQELNRLKKSFYPKPKNLVVNVS